jgi:hypothetical protein
MREYGYSAAAVARYLGVAVWTTHRLAAEAALTPWTQLLHKELSARDANLNYVHRPRTEPRPTKIIWIAGSRPVKTTNETDVRRYLPVRPA